VIKAVFVAFVRLAPAAVMALAEMGFTKSDARARMLGPDAEGRASPLAANEYVRMVAETAVPLGSWPAFR